MTTFEKWQGQCVTALLLWQVWTRWVYYGFAITSLNYDNRALRQTEFFYVWNLLLAWHNFYHLCRWLYEVDRITQMNLYARPSISDSFPCLAPPRILAVRLPAPAQLYTGLNSDLTLVFSPPFVSWRTCQSTVRYHHPGPGQLSVVRQQSGTVEE